LPFEILIYVLQVAKEICEMLKYQNKLRIEQADPELWAMDATALGSLFLRAHLFFYT
jgi:hypothetical protein